MSGINYSLALKFAQQLALDSGKIINNHFGLGISRDWKSDHTPVTAVDREINALIISSIHREFPDHSILAEEESDLSRSRDYIWVCDPLDGTFPYIHGIPTSTTAIALVYQGEPILGVIYDPYTDRLFSAAKGQGTTLNGKKINTSQVKTISDSTIGVVFWEDNANFMLPKIAKVISQHGKIIDLCSIAYMDTLVAAGELTATIFPGTSAHDSAASKIIVEEAGGIFTPLFSSESDRYDQKVHGHLACANQHIYTHIKSLLS